MIHRIDLAQRVRFGAQASVNAGQQLIWTALGLPALHCGPGRGQRPPKLGPLRLYCRLHRTGPDRHPSAVAGTHQRNQRRKTVDPSGGFSIQPGEFAKLALTVFFAAYLVTKRELLASAGRRVAGLAIPRGRDVGPLLLVWLMSVLTLVSQKDLGMAVLLFAVFLTCLYVSTARASWLIIGAGLLVSRHRRRLLRYFRTCTPASRYGFNPFANPDSGYQMQQSLFGLGTGGIFGSGLGAGHPELVPLVPHRFHRRRLRRRNRAVRTDRYHRHLRSNCLSRAANCPPHPRQLRSTARPWLGVHPRIPNLHHRGRRQQPAPRNWARRPATVLRRIGTTGQPHPHRGPATNFRPHRRLCIDDLGAPLGSKRWPAFSGWIGQG